MTILSHFFGTPHITSEQTKESLKWRWRGITKNQKTTGKCPIPTKKIKKSQFSLNWEEQKHLS